MSDLIQSIPYPTVDYPIDVTWPQIGPLASGSAFTQNGLPRYSQSPYAVFSAPTIAGAGLANMGVYNGVLCGQFETAVAAGTAEATLDGVSMFAAIRKTGLAGSFFFNEEIRVWRLSLCMALQVGAALSDQSGIMIEPADATAPGWFRAGNRGMGLSFVAGAPTFFAKNVPGVAVYSEQTALTWPGAVTEWTALDFEIQSATGTGEAVFRLYVNGGLQIERSWGVGTVLPDYSSPAGAGRYTAHVRMGNSGVAESLKIAAGMRYTGGRFTLGRAEIG